MMGGIVWPAQSRERVCISVGEGKRRTQTRRSTRGAHALFRRANRCGSILYCDVVDLFPGQGFKSLEHRYALSAELRSAITGGLYGP